MKSIFIILTVVLLLAGCANVGLSIREQQHLKEMAANGQPLIFIKSPQKAYKYGYRFAAGQFYTRHYILGTLNAIPIVTYPWSIFWVPTDARNCAERINYDATVEAYSNR